VLPLGDLTMTLDQQQSDKSQFDRSQHQLLVSYSTVFTIRKESNKQALRSMKPMLGFVLLTTHTMLHVQESHSFAPVPMAYRSRFAYSYPTNHALTLSAQSARQAIDWVRQETLTDLIPKEDVLAIIDELLSNEALMDDSEELVTKNWEKLERKLREETRPPREILGLETTDRILASVQSMDGYDPQAVNAFLESEAVNSLFSRVLYDGIFEFFQKIDVFGQIINGLPILVSILQCILKCPRRTITIVKAS
jgi:hypothetical protein